MEVLLNTQPRNLEVKPHVYKHNERRMYSPDPASSLLPILSMPNTTPDADQASRVYRPANSNRNAAYSQHVSYPRKMLGDELAHILRLDYMDWYNSGCTHLWPCTLENFPKRKR